MKKLVFFVILSLALQASCFASPSLENIAFIESMEKWAETASLDALYLVRQTLNDEILARFSADFQKTPDIDGKTLREIFPCIPLAKMIRDKIGLVSIDQVPTSEQLESITSISSYNVSNNEELDDLTGISYLPYLSEISLYQDSICSKIAELPDDFYSLRNIKYVDISGTSIKSIERLCDMPSIKTLDLRGGKVSYIPENIENLINLETLFISYTSISSLPDTICNLPRLKYLYMDSCPISDLPDNIGALTSLRELNISRTNISRLPASIYSLNLDSFDKEGLPLE